MNAERGTQNAERRKRIALPAPSSAFRVPRSGFTLLEALLVLALLVVIGGLVFPAMQRPFAAERLRKAADQLRADLTKGRVTAMNSGRSHALEFNAAAGRYAVVPLDDLSASDPFSLPAAEGPREPTVAFYDVLPEGVTIAAVSALDDVTPPPALAPLAQANAAAAPSRSDASAGSQTIYFHPDGTTSSAEITLAGEYGDRIQVRLRGLTGATAASELYVGEIR